MEILSLKTVYTRTCLTYFLFDVALLLHFLLISRTQSSLACSHAGPVDLTFSALLATPVEREGEPIKDSLLTNTRSCRVKKLDLNCLNMKYN